MHPEPDPETRPASDRLSAIVLAAGESRRMGPANKLLLDLGGSPLIRRVVATVASCPWQEIVVVLGFEAEQVGAALDGLPVRLAVNDQYREGQPTSVRRGLAALRASCDGVAIFLGDQPAIDSHDIELLRRAFADRGAASVVVPTFAGRRGNPILLDRHGIDEILRRGARFGCRHFISRYGDLVTTIAMPRDHVVRDVDTPADYAALT
jgi:molybdenum cofactor cytidylyltransferase